MERNEKLAAIFRNLGDDQEYGEYKTDPVGYLEREGVKVQGIENLEPEQKESIRTALREIEIPKEEGLTWIPCPVCKGLIITTCGAIIVGTILACILTDGIAAAAEEAAVEGAVEVVAAETGLTTARVWQIIEAAWAKTGPLQFLGVAVAMLCEAMGDC